MDWHGKVSSYTGFALLGLIILSLASALILGLKSHVILGLLSAGVAGTATSIVIKLPPLSVYGEMESFKIRMIGRFAAGVIASIIGIGLLSTGVLNIKFGNFSPQEIIRCSLVTDPGCTQDCKFSWVLALISLTMLFGFSERALVKFEEVIFGKSDSKEG